MASIVCINESLTDDELRSVLLKLESEKDKEAFGLVCKRWLYLQNSERKKLAARAGPQILRKLAARFPMVVELDLSRSSYPWVTDSDLSVIADDFRSLRLLTLTSCKGITDAGMVKIGCSLSSLQSLDVSYCLSLTDKSLSAVAEGCCNLRSLRLCGCRVVTDKVLEALSKNCNNLEELWMDGCRNITDSGLKSLSSGCQLIKFLDINKCCNVGDSGVSSVSKACSSSLKTLKLLGCYIIGDESILSLARFCKNLETLVIGGCRDISDESIKSLACACKNSLKNLRMDLCLNISDSSLSCILNQCRNLEALDIRRCKEVTDSAFQGLGIGEIESPLKILKVSNCRKITVVGIGFILDKCRSLEYLDVRSCPHVTKAGCDEAGLQFPKFCRVYFEPLKYVLIE